MDKPKCRVCGEKHYSNEPHVFKDSLTKAESPRKSKPKRVSDKPGDSECIYCGATAEIFEDAEKWRRLRDKRRRYMRERRKKK